MTSKKLSLTLSLLLCSTPAYSLVDYTEKSTFRPKRSGASRVKAPKVESTSTTTNRSSRSSGPSGMVSAALIFQDDNVKLGDVSGKAQSIGIKTHFQTNYNIFLDASYAQAKMDNSLYGGDSSYQKGNPEVTLGFNWLRFGNPMEEATIDLIAGASIGQSNSDFGSSRTDKIFGVTTAKRFYDFAIGIGYTMRVSGQADESELAIGNVSVLSASLGWVVSQDISFLVEGNSYTIGRSTDSVANKLDEKEKVSVVSPQLILKMSPMIDLNLGANFATRRLKDETLLGARLWNLPGKK